MDEKSNNSGISFFECCFRKLMFFRDAVEGICPLAVFLLHIFLENFVNCIDKEVY